MIMTEAMFRLRQRQAMDNNFIINKIENYSVETTDPIDEWPNSKIWEEWFQDFSGVDTRPQYCKKTGRKLTYDVHTGEALDAETLIPIDNFVDFSSKSIL